MDVIEFGEVRGGDQKMDWPFVDVFEMADRIAGRSASIDGSGRRVPL